MLEQKCTILNTGAVAFYFKLNTMTTNGWVFVSGFALHNAQFKAQKLMAKLAQIPC